MDTTFDHQYYSKRKFDIFNPTFTFKISLKYSKIKLQTYVFKQCLNKLLSDLIEWHIFSKAEKLLLLEYSFLNFGRKHDKYAHVKECQLLRSKIIFHVTLKYASDSLFSCSITVFLNVIIYHSCKCCSFFKIISIYMKIKQ